VSINLAIFSIDLNSTKHLTCQDIFIIDQDVTGLWVMPIQQVCKNYISNLMFSEIITSNGHAKIEGYIQTPCQIWLCRSWHDVRNTLYVTQKYRGNY